MLMNSHRNSSPQCFYTPQNRVEKVSPVPHRFYNSAVIDNDSNYTSVNETNKKIFDLDNRVNGIENKLDKIMNSMDMLLTKIDRK